MTSEQLFFWSKFLVPLGFGLWACVSDIRHRKIPNWLSVTLGCLGILIGLVFGGVDGLVQSLGGFATGFGTLFVLYAIGGSGAGDVKFMGGVGACVGPYHVLFVFVLSAIILGVYAVGVLLLRLLGPSKKLSEGGPRGEAADASKPLGRDRLPYAVPASAAILLRLVWLIFLGRVA